jgi:hypothetical protein
MRLDGEQDNEHEYYDSGSVEGYVNKDSGKYTAECRSCRQLRQIKFKTLRSIQTEILNFQLSKVINKKCEKINV